VKNPVQNRFPWVGFNDCLEHAVYKASQEFLLRSFQLFLTEATMGFSIVSLRSFNVLKPNAGGFGFFCVYAMPWFDRRPSVIYVACRTF